MAPGLGNETNMGSLARTERENEKAGSSQRKAGRRMRGREGRRNEGFSHGRIRVSRLISLMVSWGRIWGCRRRTEKWLHGGNQRKNHFSDFFFFSGLRCKMLSFGQHSDNPGLKHWHSRTFWNDPVCL